MCMVKDEDLIAILELNKKLVREADELRQEITLLNIRLKHAQSHLDWWREVTAKENGE
jgi:hypothetical protein